MERAVGQFNQRYQRYAATQARRRARSLRSAQTGFDNASRDLNDGRLALGPHAPPKPERHRRNSGRKMRWPATAAGSTSCRTTRP